MGKVKGMRDPFGRWEQDGIKAARRWQRAAVRYVHYRTAHHGAVTLAVSESDGMVRWGCAFCSPRDQFSRDRGRHIAAGRLRKGAPPLLPGPPDEGLYARCERHLAALLQEREAYDRVDPPPRRESCVPRWFPRFMFALAAAARARAEGQENAKK